MPRRRAPAAGARRPARRRHLHRAGLPEVWWTPLPPDTDLRTRGARRRCSQTHATASFRCCGRSRSIHEPGRSAARRVRARAVAAAGARRSSVLEVADSGAEPVRIAAVKRDRALRRARRSRRADAGLSGRHAARQAAGRRVARRARRQRRRCCRIAQVRVRRRRSANTAIVTLGRRRRRAVELRDALHAARRPTRASRVLTALFNAGTKTN